MKHEMGSAFSMCEIRNLYTFFAQKTCRSKPIKDLEIDGKVIIKLILNKYGGNQNFLAQ
jgi:hypothetical protein